MEQSNNYVPDSILDTGDREWIKWTKIGAFTKAILVGNKNNKQDK